MIEFGLKTSVFIWVLAGLFAPACLHLAFTQGYQSEFSASPRHPNGSGRDADTLKHEVLRISTLPALHTILRALTRVLRKLPDFFGETILPSPRWFLPTNHFYPPLQALHALHVVFFHGHVERIFFYLYRVFKPWPKQDGSHVGPINGKIEETIHSFNHSWCTYSGASTEWRRMSAPAEEDEPAEAKNDVKTKEPSQAEKDLARVKDEFNGPDNDFCKFVAILRRICEDRGLKCVSDAIYIASWYSCFVAWDDATTKCGEA